MCSHALASGFHPEQPARITSLWEGLVAEGMAAAARRVPARLATKEEVRLPPVGRCNSPLDCEHLRAIPGLLGISPQILMVHEARHWDQLEWAVAQEAQALQRWCASQESLYLNAASMRAARLASGAVMELTQQVRFGRSPVGMTSRKPGRDCGCIGPYSTCLARGHFPLPRPLSSSTTVYPLAVAMRLCDVHEVTWCLTWRSQSALCHGRSTRSCVGRRGMDLLSYGHLDITRVGCTLPDRALSPSCPHLWPATYRRPSGA